MCSINPKHHLRVRLDLYTSHPVSADEFMELVLGKVLEAEMLINSDGRVRAIASNPETINV